MENKNEFTKYMKGFGRKFDEEIKQAQEAGDLDAELFARFQKFGRTVRAGQRAEFDRRGCGRGPVPADSLNAEAGPLTDFAEAKGPDFGPGFGGPCGKPGKPGMSGAWAHGPKGFKGQCGPKGPEFGHGFGPKGPGFGGPCGMPGMPGRMNDRGPAFGGPKGPDFGRGFDPKGPEAFGPCGKPEHAGNPMNHGHLGRGRVLTALAMQDGMTQKDLAFLLGIRPQSLGELLGKLEADGFITRERSEADKRACIVKLTDAGREKAAHVDEMRHMSAETMFAKLSDEEKAQLCALLAKLED